MTVELAEPARPALPTLSPSRAADFKTCPLLYRFRSIDRLPERPTPDQLRGTLVHAVLERLFDLPAEQRTQHHAAELVEPQWQRMVEEHAELLDIFADAPTADAPTADAAAGGDGSPAGTDGDASTAGELVASATELLGGYFAVEDPRRLAPAERECLVSVEVDDGRLLLRGYVDRLD